MFKNNKYTKIYFKIMETRRGRILCENEYYENHHIIPKSLGGKNDIENMIYLTAKEHFIAHLLLTKMTEDKNREKMLYALHCISHVTNKHTNKRYVNSRLYEYLKKDISVARSEFMKTNNPMHNIEVRKKHSESIIKRGPTSGNTGMKHSQETKIKISESNAGKKQSESTKEKIRQKAKEQWERRRKEQLC